MKVCIALLCMIVVVTAQPRVILFNNYTWSLLAWGFPNGGQDTTDGMKVVDLDIDLQNDQISGLTSAGHIVMCYFSAGSVESWRPDVQANPQLWAEASGGNMSGWDEPWLDITQLSLLQELMAPRFTKAVNYGCNAIEPDNTDCYANQDCWSTIGLSSSDEAQPYQIKYNLWLAQIAHQNGLSIALKNTLGLIDQIGDQFDCAVNEECQTYQECDGYSQYVASNKAIFQVWTPDFYSLTSGILLIFFLFFSG
eukprot:TRINITY_DN726_c1_g1_i1.p1 TRINITY_DN726_c1_g1~~TRINITY_DN726_c1_g1_i1.p1  ORF type:complete len:252 (-),score=37.25 TRINITY_DN726_c1_g1_i1:214-969(-)